VIQREEVDYSQTFAPVAQLASVELLISLAAFYQCRLVQLVVITHSSIQIYSFLKVCLLLKKGLYGLKRAPYSWDKAVDLTLERLMFTRGKSDPCFYVRVEQDVKRTVSSTVIAIYVDHVILTSTQMSY
jgi:hypothetical protein